MNEAAGLLGHRVVILGKAKKAFHRLVMAVAALAPTVQSWVKP